jgi:hypothetical protein
MGNSRNIILLLLLVFLAQITEHETDKEASVSDDIEATKRALFEMYAFC